MIMMNDKTALEIGYVPLKRCVVEEIENGNTTSDEFVLFFYLAAKANPFNLLVKTSHPTIAEALSLVGVGWTANKVTKLMLKLKERGWIDYPEHQGRKGLFYVKVSRDFIHQPGATYKKSQDSAPPGAEVSDIQQKLEEQKKGLLKSFKSSIQLDVSRGAKNDNETKKNNYIFDDKNLIPIEDFIPKSMEEAECKRIAESLGETHMNCILKWLSKAGLSMIRVADGRVREAKDVKNPGGYFNEIMKQLFTEKDKSDTIVDSKPL